MKWLLWIVACLGLLLTGCNTTILVASGKEFSDYQKSIKPYIAYWQKEGMTEEERLADWVACGGMKDGGFGYPLDPNARLSGESEREFMTRLDYAFQRCMIRSGYYYTGDCSSEYMKARPLCGAHK